MRELGARAVRRELRFGERRRGATGCLRRMDRWSQKGHSTVEAALIAVKDSYESAGGAGVALLHNPGTEGSSRSSLHPPCARKNLTDRIGAFDVRLPSVKEQG